MKKLLMLVMLLSVCGSAFAGGWGKPTCDARAWSSGALGWQTARNSGHPQGSHEFQVIYEKERDNLLCNYGCDPRKYSYADYELGIIEKGNACQ